MIRQAMIGSRPFIFICVSVVLFFVPSPANGQDADDVIRSFESITKGRMSVDRTRALILNST